MACHLFGTKLSSGQIVAYYTPSFNEVEKEVYRFHLVRPSICGQNRVHSVSSTILIGSISCLQYYQVTSEGVSRVMFVSKLKNLKFLRNLEICNFDFVFFWLGIQYDSIVWVIMRRQGYPKNTGILVLIGPLEQISRKFTSPLPPKKSSKIMHLKSELRKCSSHFISASIFKTISGVWILQDELKHSK